MQQMVFKIALIELASLPEVEASSLLQVFASGTLFTCRYTSAGLH
jgi:hypothetical protein